MTTIETTIKGGLPVLAEGTVLLERETRYQPGSVDVDDLAIRWRSGHVCRLDVSVADHDRICDELIEAREPWEVD